jgi:hypothetical protein
MSFTLEDEEPLGFTTSLENDRPILPAKQLEEKVRKLDYALGQESPGADKLRTQFQSGEEDVVRKALVSADEAKFYGMKQQMLSDIAQRRGSTLSQEEADVVLGMTQAEYRADPETIIERKFAQKFVDDIVTSTNKQTGQVREWEAAIEDIEIGTNVIAEVQYYKNKENELAAKWDQSSFLGKAADFGGQLIPFLPWWRQKQALENREGVEFLQGTTMAANVRYLWSLPPDLRRAEYTKAIAYLENKNLLDAMDFARAMNSFGTSDEYIANTITMADYSTAGSFVGKLFTKGAAKASKAGAAAEQAAKNTEQTPYKEPLRITDQTSTQYKKQGELFPGFEGRTSDQMVNQAEMFGGDLGSRPTGLPRGPGGRFMGQAQRSVPFEGMDGPYSIGKRTPEPEVNPNTGVYRGQGGRFDKATTNLRQDELPLGTRAAEGQEAQKSFEFPAPTPAQQEVRQVLSDAVKAMEVPNPRVEDLLSATGRVEEAANTAAARRITGNQKIETLDDLVHEVPSFAAPAQYYGRSNVLHRERGMRLADAAGKVADELKNVFLNAARGARITDEALQVGLKQAEAFLRNEYKAFSDTVIGVRHTPADFHPANVDTLTMQLGTTEAKPFATREQAELFKRDVYGLGDEAIIRRQGDAWFIELDRIVTETNDEVRDALLTLNNSSTTNMFKMFADRLLSAATILPGFQMAQRHVATHAQQQVRATVKQIIDDVFVSGMNKSERKEVMQILELNRDTTRPNNPMKRGMWYQTSQELEAAFMDKFGKLPGENQIVAYDTYKRLSDFDWLMRNTSAYRDKARMGVEDYQFTAGGTKSGWFEGVKHEKMPWSIGKQDQDAGIWVWNSETNSGKFYYKYNMEQGERAAVDKLIADKGYSVIQVFDPKTHPLKGIAKTADGSPLNEQVNYIITNTADRRNLSWKQVEYEPGGHVIYKHNWYIAQPQIEAGRLGKSTYLGDNLVLNIETQAQAKMWAERMDHARQLLRLGKEDELRKYVSSKLPYSVEEFKDLFLKGNAPLTLHEPIRFKEAGRRTIDTIPGLKQRLDSEELIDITRNPHDLSAQMDRSFLMERDHQLYTVKDGPKPNLVKSENLDPFVSMNRAMGQAFQNVWMTDYKIAAVEQWIQQWGKQGILKPSEKTLQSYPMYFLYHPQWNENFADRSLRAAAEAERKSIINFIGARSELGLHTDWLTTKLQDSIYNLAGQGKILDATLAATVDPVRALRATAFHTKLGLFNPVQFFVQTQAMAHVLAVGGVHGMHGFTAGVIASMSRGTVQHSDQWAKLAGKMGWKEADFTEMMTLMEKSGVYQVAGEAALRNDAFDPKLFRSSVGNFLFESGTMFFAEGERLVRLAAFATAYREFKAANAGVKVGNRQLAEIMNRSDLLSVNMTRASNAAWQEGLASVPTQFMAFNARFMEQMIGKRLTPMEKLRAFSVYSGLYGIPVGVGSVVGVWPVYDSFREEAAKRNIQFDETHEKILTEGFLSYLTTLATGQEYNVPQRLGPGNNSTIRDIMKGDKSLPEILGGASGTILGDILKTSYPFYHAASSVFRDNGDYPTTGNDWLNLARNISSVDLVTKQAFIFAYGKWLTKSGTSVGPANSMDAVMAIVGLTPKSIADVYIDQKAIKSEKDGQSWYERDAIENFRRGMQALQRGNDTEYETYMTRARTSMKAGDFTLQDQNRIFSRAVDSTKDLADTIEWQKIQRAPAGKQQERLEQMLNKKGIQ